ncbi:MAG: hypothetical protein HY537_17910 [Deltaproteobacteria bacterium]|nr:hypothetical protein [Deltaproteobacteria bacterium]
MFHFLMTLVFFFACTAYGEGYPLQPPAGYNTVNTNVAPSPSPSPSYQPPQPMGELMCQVQKSMCDWSCKPPAISIPKYCTSGSGNMLVMYVCGYNTFEPEVDQACLDLCSDAYDACI